MPRLSASSDVLLGGKSVAPPALGPEHEARKQIDTDLASAGWAVQDRADMNVFAAQGVAIREFPLSTGHADYMLFVDGQAVGALEAKKPGHTLKGVEVQSSKYAKGLPPALHPPVVPLPFLYESNGEETQFTNLLDPDPRSRRVFRVHRPQTLAEWLVADPLPTWTQHWSDAPGVADAVAHYGDPARPSSLRGRVRTLPPLDPAFLRGCQVEAIHKLERSLRENRPRALLQMATGSGKTIAAVTQIYRLIKFGGARRVLFLVDRGNLGEQAEKEFQNFRTPDDRRKFTELYKVQRLTSNTIADSTKVVITTIQRFYSMLKGEPEFDPAQEDTSPFVAESPFKEPLPVVYNPTLSPEFFDVVFIDECHRSIYTLWRQVLEYFDAFLVGLTATPAKHTYGFFNGNLVMEYPHEKAVADGVNVDFEVYRIRTKITQDGATIEATNDTRLGIRDRRTRAVRWESLDEDVTYKGDDLDRSVVSRDQIRTIIRTFRDRLFTQIFPGRKEVPKTLVFCKDDSHAEDVIDILREEFGGSNAFAQKITYRTTGAKASDLIQEFRNSYDPRIAVTVDMVATGTDIRPVEIILFLRSVKSRVLFEQMKGRGVRVIDPNELIDVTPDAVAKTHFVIVDCVGITDSTLADTHPLERKKKVSTKALLDHVAMGGVDPDTLSSLASRLARLSRQCGPAEVQRVKEASGGPDLADLNRAIVDSLDVDRHEAQARGMFGLSPDQEPSDAQVAQAARRLMMDAVKPLATNPGLRELILTLKAQFEQFIDDVSRDALLFAGPSDAARDKATQMVQSFEAFLAEHKDEIDALSFFYSQPYGKRLRYADIKALAQAIQEPPRLWTPEALWRAYELLRKDQVHGSGRRILTDIVSLVRFALRQQNELVPYAEQVRVRFAGWMAQQQAQGRRFTAQQAQWLEMIRDHIATSLEIEVEDFDYAPFAEQGGLGRASQVFGKDLGTVLRELNEVLAA